MRTVPGTIGLGASMVLAGVLFAIPSLAVPGVGLLALGALAGGWVGLAGRGARAECRASATRAIEGEGIEVSLTVRPGRIPLPGAELRWAGEERSFGLRAAPLELRQTERAGRRGRTDLGPGELAIRDPLGIARLRLPVFPARALVLPRPTPGPLLRGAARPGPRGLDRVPGPEIEPDGLRPYRPGAPSNRIDWRTLARRGELMERRMLPDPDSIPLVVVDPSGATSCGPEALDETARLAAALCLELARRGGCSLLAPGLGRPLPIGPDLRSWPQAHARLALLGDAGGAATAPARARGEMFRVCATADHGARILGGAPPGPAGRGWQGRAAPDPRGGRGWAVPE